MSTEEREALKHQGRQAMTLLVAATNGLATPEGSVLSDACNAVCRAIEAYEKALVGA